MFPGKDLDLGKLLLEKSVYGAKKKLAKSGIFVSEIFCFGNPRLCDDVSFHPCVRFKKWEVSVFFLFNLECVNSCKG